MALWVLAGHRLGHPWEQQHASRHPAERGGTHHACMKISGPSAGSFWRAERNSRRHRHRIISKCAPVALMLESSAERRLYFSSLHPLAAWRNPAGSHARDYRFTVLCTRRRTGSSVQLKRNRPAKRQPRVSLASTPQLPRTRALSRSRVPARQNPEALRQKPSVLAVRRIPLYY